MDRLIFSQAAVFHLQQLANHLHQHTGVRHKLSSTEGILNLLKACTKILSPQARESDDALIMELNKRQLDVLAEYGLILQPSVLPQAARKLG